MATKKHKSRNRRSARTTKVRRAWQIWSGTITFGLVSVPIQMLPAHRSQRVALREVAADGTPLRRRFFCPDEDHIVPQAQIVRGFEFKPGRYVAVRDAELEALEPQKSREIDLQRFVDRDEISPLFYERSYYLAPDGDSNKAYRLLARVLEKTNRAGIATFVMHDREYVIAIIGEGGLLRGQTLRFLDEVRQPADIGLPARVEVDRRLAARFERTIRKQAKDRLDTRALEDEAAERLKRLVEQKRKRGTDVVKVKEIGEDAERDAADRDEEETDLLETIRRRLGRHLRADHSANGHAHRHGKHTSAKNQSKPRNRTHGHRRSARPEGKGARLTLCMVESYEPGNLSK